ADDALNREQPQRDRHPSTSRRVSVPWYAMTRPTPLIATSTDTSIPPSPRGHSDADDESGSAMVIPNSRNDADSKRYNSAPSRASSANRTATDPNRSTTHRPSVVWELTRGWLPNVRRHSSPSGFGVTIKSTWTPSLDGGRPPIVAMTRAIMPRPRLTRK